MYDMQPYLTEIARVIAQGPFQDTWDSLVSHPVPDWYRNAKFGIFIHWGVYSVPAFGNEWYPRNMYIEGTPEYRHHLETYGSHREFGYKDFIPEFVAASFDPDEWISLFKSAGARYVVPVAEHHDGFQMYKSEISHWNAYEMGPHRDVTGELKSACDRAGLAFGASSHRIEHWFFQGPGRTFDSDVKEPLTRGDLYWPAAYIAEKPEAIDSQPGPSEEYMQDWLVRTCEIVDRFQPGIVYFDWWIYREEMRPYLRRFAAYYYNRAAEWGREVAINYKFDAFAFGSAVPDVERGQFADMQPYFWQTDTAIALNSWCYTEHNDFRPAPDIIRDLADIVSKNGTLLLNVGPKPDGTITDEDKAVLLSIGKWLKINGEAIYDAVVWKKYGEGPTRVKEGGFTDRIRKNYTSEDFRFTVKGGNLYAIAMGQSETGEYCIRSLAGENGTYRGIIRDVDVLGSGEKPTWSRDADALVIHCGLKSDSPIVFRVRLD